MSAHVAVKCFTEGGLKQRHPKINSLSPAPKDSAFLFPTYRATDSKPKEGTNQESLKCYQTGMFCNKQAGTSNHFKLQNTSASLISPLQLHAVICSPQRQFLFFPVTKIKKNSNVYLVSLAFCCKTVTTGNKLKWNYFFHVSQPIIQVLA